MDAKNGKRLARFPWRAKKNESVNASTPIVLSGNRIFISECYEIGGVMLEFDAEFQPKEVWKERWFGMHWMTPVREGDYLYGFAGRNEPDVEFKCFDARTGEKKWNEDLKWKADRKGRSWTYGYFRGSLLKVDGSYLCLGEHGALAWMDLTPEGVKMVERSQLFFAPHAWTLPAVSRGLLYVSQHEKDADTGKGARLICYDLRGE